jgi:hypothetical protein
LRAHSLKPLIFEVGKHGPFQLTQPKPKTANSYVHPRSPRQRHWLDEHGGALIFIGASSLVVFMLVSLTDSTGQILFVPKSIVVPIKARKIFSSIRHVLRSLYPWDFDLNQRHSQNGWIFAIIISLIFLSIILYIAVKDHSSPCGEPFVFFASSPEFVGEFWGWKIR